MLQFANQNFVFVVAGCSGSGKSTFAIRYLNNAKLTCRFIFDTSGEFSNKFARRACQTAEELRAAVVTGWVIFDPHFLFPGNSKKALEMFCEWAWVMSRGLSGQKMVYADEIWKYCNPNAIPEKLALICQDGRKHGVGLIVTTQRPNRLNEAIMGECTEFVGFNLVGSNKLDYLERNLDDYPVRELPNLVLIDRVRTQFIAQNIRSRALRRYEMDFVTQKIREL